MEAAWIGKPITQVCGTSARIRPQGTASGSRTCWDFASSSGAATSAAAHSTARCGAAGMMAQAGVYGLTVDKTRTGAVHSRSDG